MLGMNTSLRARYIVIFGVASIGGSALVHAATIDWINPAGGSYQLGSNWSGGAAPSAADTARFSPLGSALDISFAAGPTNDRLIVASGADVAFRISPFNFVVNGLGATGVTVGDVPSATPARLDIVSGSLSSFNATLGELEGSAGIGAVHSGNWSATQSFIIGNAGAATFTSMANAFFSAGSLTIGSQPTGRGFVQADGAVFLTNGPLRVGRLGVGTLLVTGRTSMGTGPLIVGDEAGSSGTVDLRSNVEWAPGTISIGNSGSGTLLVGADGTIDASNSVCFGQQPASRGWVSVDGGSLFTSMSLNVGGSDAAAGGDGRLVINSGTVSVLRTLRAWDNGRIDWNGGSLSTGSIDLRGGGAMTMSAGTVTKLLKTRSVTIDLAGASGGGGGGGGSGGGGLGGSRLDLNDNDALLTATTTALVESYIASARGGGEWNGPGLTSAAARSHANHATTLGVLRGADYIAANGNSTFDGSTVAAGDVLVKYTWYGDTDFNGVVNFDDYVRTDNGFNTGGTRWFQGDFDLNAVVDFDDYVLIDLAFNVQNGTLRRALQYLDGGAAAGEAGADGDAMNDPALRMVTRHWQQFGEPYARSFLAAVPEPGSMAMLASAALVGLRRRRNGAAGGS